MIDPTPRHRRPAACKICRHAERARIELLAATGIPHMQLAKQFSVSRHALSRHWNLHLTPARRAELMGSPAAIERLARRAADEHRSSLDYLCILRSELFKIFEQTQEKGYFADSSSVAKRLTDVLVKIAEMTGELAHKSGIGVVINNNVSSIANTVNTGPSLSIMNDQGVVKVMAIISKALEHQPEARSLVFMALRKADNPASRGNGHADKALPAPVTIEGEVADA